MKLTKEIVVFFLFGILVGILMQSAVQKLTREDPIQDAITLTHWLETTSAPDFNTFKRNAQNIAREEQVVLAEKALAHGHVTIFRWLYGRYYEQYGVAMSIPLDAILETALIRGDKNTCEMITHFGSSRVSLCNFVVTRAFPDVQHADVASWVQERLCSA